MKVLDLSRESSLGRSPDARSLILGADVVKIEPPDGLMSRDCGVARPPVSRPTSRSRTAASEMFASTCRPMAALSWCCNSPSRPTWLIENFRPGVMAKFGAGLGCRACSSSGADHVVNQRLRSGRPGGAARRVRLDHPCRNRAFCPTGSVTRWPLDLDLSAADVLSGMHGCDWRALGASDARRRPRGAAH